ncbi:Caspase Nc [Camponotus floridanus]|uniref:Caspase Nc n=1 Tax=Camponotus floridanus TaxID=104421 RepID=E1ZYI2_CAMFO|nr:caspase-3 [Camponotus floridanus]EFN73736.1 Caspase Nc [Camponotus floridanus]
MEQRDRDQINYCCDKVVSKIDMTRLLPILVQNKVYNNDDTNMSRWMKNTMDPDTIKVIFLTIKTRGPHAFKNLILSLRQTDHENVADILEGKISINNTNNTSNTSFNQEDNSFINHSSDKPLTIKLCKATRFLDREYHDLIERYPMRSKPRGLVLIISNIDYKLEDKPRFSATHDAVNLQKLFEEMGFKVIVHQNLNGSQINEVIKTFSKHDDLGKVDSCFVIVTSHGTEDKNSKDKENNTEIQGLDFSTVSKQENYEKVLCEGIYDYFTAEACPQLAGKPKIFIFQLCRGKRKQNAVFHSRTVTDSIISNPNNEYNITHEYNTSNLSTRNYSDMLIVYSTLPGYVSYRDKITGSWFIHYLCSIFMNYAYKTHIYDLFTMVDAHLKRIRTGCNECQTSSILSWGFNKHCYLNPGHFES